MAFLMSTCHRSQSSSSEPALWVSGNVAEGFGDGKKASGEEISTRDIISCALGKPPICFPQLLTSHTVYSSTSIILFLFFLSSVMHHLGNPK